MYNTTAEYKVYIKKPSRQFQCKVTLGTRIFDNNDIIQIVPNIVQPQNGFSIGNTISQSIDIALKNDNGVYASVGKIDAEIGLKIENSIEYIKIGTFNIDDVTKTDYTVKITAYDNMIKFETPYFSSLGNTPTLQQVVDELASITGVAFTGTVPNYTVTKLKGFTCREVLGYVASVCGGNAYITRDGKFTILYPHEVDCTVTADNYIGSGYKIEDQVYKIGMITCQNKNNTASTDSEDYDSVNDENTISVGSLSSNTMELTFENPWVTESILNDIYNRLNGFSYLGYTMKWQGDLSLDPLDIITVIDKNNVTRKALIFANKLKYTGGLTAETSAKGETKNSNSFSANGPSAKDIQRLSVQLLIAEKAIITKASIKDLQANSARIDDLQASVATIDTALINYATVSQLDAVKANVANLFAADATINNTLINKANIADLNAANANIANLSSDMANVKTLVNGNLTSANIQSLVLTSSKVTVDNGFIKNAMIESLDATKINTGSLNTGKVSVTSSDGSLLIAGATQQFKDKNGKVRIQMGQDAQGNFNFILVASDGTTTLIDGYGIKANAIADKLIKTNMVADSAIGEQQINYSSFATGFNKSTNTNYIKASKVAIDLTGQSLDIAFNNINTTVTNVQTTSNTAISTANSANTTAASASTTASAASTAASTAVTTANNAVSTANTANTIANTASTNASSAVSTASTALTNSSAAVTTANSTKSSIDNLQIGGRNLIPNSKIAATSSAYGFGTRNLTIDLVAGNTYTFTVNGRIDAQAVTDGKTLNCYVNENTLTHGAWSFAIGTITDTTKSIVFTASWTGRYVVAFYLYPSGGSRLGTATVNWAKLELGNKATDWTPAPEDIDASIASVQTITNTNTTSISAIQGQITTLISNTTIIKDGTTTQLKDAYNGTVTTVNSMLTTIGEHTSKIDTANANITSVTSKEAALEVTVNSINATLTDTKSTVTTHTTQISTANTNITTALNNASTAVTTANTATTTANTAKTTATTASTDATAAKTIANTASTNASTALTNANSAVTTSNTASTNASNAVTTANQASTDVATLTASVNTVTSRVAAVELTARGLTTRVGATETAISSLQIGGRNLFRGYPTNSKLNQKSSGYYTTIYPNILLEPNTTYTFSYKYEVITGTIAGLRIGIGGGNLNSYTLDYVVWNNALLSKGVYTFTTPSTLSAPYFQLRPVLNIKNDRTLYEVNFWNIKLEKGNMATDWTPAPEDVDSSITAVKDYVTTTINSNVSTINQTTNAISASVTALQSRATTIETTLGNKADTTTVTAISNRTATLETSVTGINASITTINSNVSSVTTTANAAKSAIDNLSIGGRNLLLKANYSSWNYIPTGMTNGKSGYGFKLLTTETTPTRTITNLKLKINTSYTISFVAWCDSGTQIINNDLFPDTLPENEFTITTTATKYSWILSSTSADMSSCSLRFFKAGTISTNVYITDIKLEGGNKATDWTPAPEDVDSQITTINSNVSSLQSSVSVLQNQISLKVEQSNIDSAVTTINGQIAAQNTTISSLQSQINLQAGQISSKVEQSVFNNTIDGISSNNICNESYLTGFSVTLPVYNNGYTFDTGLGSGIKISSSLFKLSTNYILSFSIKKNSGNLYIIGGHCELFESHKVYVDGVQTDTNFALPSNNLPNDTNYHNVVIYAKTKSSFPSDSNIYIQPNRIQYKSACNVTIKDIQVKEAISSSGVGTIITQSPTQVMTAFNNISNYFQVSADGAKFGDLSTGAYTKMSQKGLEHVDSTGAIPYFYRTFRGSASVDTSGGSSTLDIQIPSEAVTLFNGYKPNAIVMISSAYGPGSYLRQVGIFGYMTNPTTLHLAFFCSSGNVKSYTSVGETVYYSDFQSGHIDINYVLFG